MEKLLRVVAEREREREIEEGRWNQISEKREVREIQASNYYTAFTRRSKKKKPQDGEKSCHDRVIKRDILICTTMPSNGRWGGLWQI